MEYLYDDIIGILIGYIHFDDLSEFVKLSNRIKRITFNRYPETEIEIKNISEGLLYQDLVMNMRFTISEYQNFGNGVLSLLPNIVCIDFAKRINDIGSPLWHSCGNKLLKQITFEDIKSLPNLEGITICSHWGESNNNIGFQGLHCPCLDVLNDVINQDNINKLKEKGIQILRESHGYN